jgi:titin
VSETAQPTEPKTPTEPNTQCGSGTVLNSQGVCVVVDPEPEPEPAPVESGPKKTHIPGFPDPTKDPQYYINRYNSEAAYKEWFDRNFPDQTIYEVIGVPEPEPPEEPKCGAGTHLENGVCVLDKEKQQLLSSCLVATATYGTELAPQVQQLREMRQNTLLATNSGTTFLSGFNNIYYSFSPTIADWERQSPVFKELVKITITPLLSTLSILNYIEIDSEQEMLGYGVGIILLNAGIYFGTPTVVFLLYKNRTKNKLGRS